MRFSTRRQVRYARRKTKASSRSKVHHHLKGKRKIVHTIHGKKVKGIYYKGRFYVERKHIKGHKIHHTVVHKGKHYHAVSKHKESSLHKAWSWVKEKYKTHKENVVRKKYYKENLSSSEREQVKRDIERKNSFAVKGSSNDNQGNDGEYSRIERQKHYDSEENARYDDQKD